MASALACPHCKRPLQLPDGMAGRQVRCPHCQGAFAVPASAPVPILAAPTPAAAPAKAPAARTCPACQAPLRRGALSCLECGHMIEQPAAPRPVVAPPIEVAPISVAPIEVSPVAVRPAAVRAVAPPPIAPQTVAPSPVAVVPSAASPLDFRQWHPALRLLPAGLLAFILLVFMVRDRFVSGESEPEEPDTPVVELPIDPDPLLAVKFQQAGGGQTGTLRFGLTMLKGDEMGKPKKLTFQEDGNTNTALTQIDGAEYLFGKFVYGSRSGDGPKGDDSGFRADPSKELQLLRGSWRDPRIALGKDRTGRERIGQKSVYFYDLQKVEVAQTVEIVPGEQVAPGQTKRQLNTCLVRYRLENQDDRPHRVGFRFVLDTFIGGNDGVPFTIPGESGLVETSKDFATPSSVPDFIQAQERSSIKDPGTVAHLTFRLGGRVEAPERVTLGRWVNQLQFPAGSEPRIAWQFPVRPMNEKLPADSCVVFYWEAKEMLPGSHRELGFAYGLGSVSGSEGGGKLGLTVGGSFRPGEDFTVTAKVNDPLPRQTVTLEVPRGLKLAGGEATQTVPPLPPDAASRDSLVTWKVKAARPGRFTLRVKTSNGAMQRQDVTITSNGIFD
jgi:LSD1 subclass zinc finger protein